MISSLGIGILTSTVARTPQQVLFLIWFIMIFFILLSGFFIPVENMPHWVQGVSCINPVRYCMFAIREMFLKGPGSRTLEGASGHGCHRRGGIRGLGAPVSPPGEMTAMIESINGIAYR